MFMLPLAAAAALSAGGAAIRRGLAATSAVSAAPSADLLAAEAFAVETESSPGIPPRV